MRDLIDGVYIADEIECSRNPILIANIKEGTNILLFKKGGKPVLRLRHKNQRSMEITLEGNDDTPLIQLKNLLIR